MTERPGVFWPITRRPPWSTGEIANYVAILPNARSAINYRRIGHMLRVQSNYLSRSVSLKGKKTHGTRHDRSSTLSMTLRVELM